MTITLPASPAIGDIVRVSGAGAGGWKLAQNAGQSVLGANLGLVGTTWTPRANTLNWRCVASSADGTKLVAGADGGQDLHLDRFGRDLDARATPAGMVFRRLVGRWHQIGRGSQ